MKNLKGVGVAVVTPFHTDKSIDYKALERVVEHVIEGGSDYLVVLGTTGEATTLTPSEKREVLAFVKKVNKKRLPIVYGVGGNNTQAVLQEIKSIDFSEVDALLSVSPYYNKPTQKGIILHFEQIADTSPVPIILYNIPGRTMSNLTAKTTLHLAAHPNIIGTKEASGILEQCMEIAAKKPSDFLLISGDDLFGSTIRAMGGEGIISVMANAYPSIFKTIVHGNQKESFQSTFKLLKINPLMYEESNPVGVKNLLMHMGICGDDVRLPLVNASDELSKKIKEASLLLSSEY